MSIYKLQITRRMTVQCLLLSLIVMLTGCATKYPQVTGEQALAEQDFDYVIGPGDSLNIFVWGNSELTVTVPVRPDGK